HRAAQGRAVRLSKPVLKEELLEAVLRALGEAVERPAPAPVAIVPSAAPGAGLKLLLAEDNDVNQVLAMQMLAKAGHQISLACNGREAVEQFEKEQFDAILMDVQM